MIGLSTGERTRYKMLSYRCTDGASIEAFVNADGTAQISVDDGGENGNQTITLNDTERRELAEFLARSVDSRVQE